MRKNFGPKPQMYPMPVLIIATYNADGTPNAMNAAWGTVCDTAQVAIVLSAGHKTVKNLLKNTVIPSSATLRAMFVFVIIPPRPKPDFSVCIYSVKSLPNSTTGIIRLAGSFGGPVNMPSIICVVISTNFSEQVCLNSFVSISVFRTRNQ